MSVFKSIESRLANLVEGTFSRAFKSEVRPVEIARRLAREMDENRKAFVSRVYVPTTYSVFLSGPDFERFADHQDELKTELASYLLEHARRENLVLSERPRISIERDDRLSLGEFGIKTSPIDKASINGEKAESKPVPRSPRPSTPAAAAPVPPVVAPAAAAPPRMTPPIPPVSAPRDQASDETETVAPIASPTSNGAKLLVAGMTIVLSPEGTVLGRSSQCDVRLEDANASRQHARISASGGEWRIEDLGSTNGVLVNDARVAGATHLKAGDRIKLGHTELTFETS